MYLTATDKNLKSNIKNIVVKIILFCKIVFLSCELPFLQTLCPQKGTGAWLIMKELEYGGFITNVPRYTVSDRDSRTRKQITEGGMTGGDRMSIVNHGYAKIYAAYLLPFIRNSDPVVLAEIGILRGTGLAIWSDLFEGGRIIGLDIDLSHIKNNMENLRERGAFKDDNMEIHEFDQYGQNTTYLKRILKGDEVHICIDDGLHKNDAIISAMKSIKPFLADHFVYFIEDNRYVHEEISRLYPEFRVENFGEMTVITSRNA